MFAKKLKAFSVRNLEKQAGARLSQAQVKLKVITEVRVEIVAEGDFKLYLRVVGWVLKIKLMLSLLSTRL